LVGVHLKILRKISNDEGKALNKLAREQTKLNLLKDILLDITVCQIEGFDFREYILELYELIWHFAKEFVEPHNGEE